MHRLSVKTTEKINLIFIKYYIFYIIVIIQWKKDFEALPNNYFN